jgi:hypothetical protein
MKNPVIFVIQPQDEFQDLVFGHIAAAAAQSAIQVTRFDKYGSATGEIPKIIAGYLNDHITKADLVVVDITGGNASVMFEMGIVEAHKKPLLIISNRKYDLPISISAMHRVIFYEYTELAELTYRLSKELDEMLNHPDKYASKIQKEKRKNKVFVSYSHKDSAYLERLMVHLRPLEKDGVFDLWVDTRLKVGDKWKKEITTSLNKSNIAILLISADFLASEFITNNELPQLLQKAELEGTKILPMILKPCRFTRDKNLKHFHSINDPEKPMVLLSEGEREYFYDKISEEIEIAVQENVLRKDAP